MSCNNCRRRKICTMTCPLTGPCYYFTEGEPEDSKIIYQPFENRKVRRARERKEIKNKKYKNGSKRIY